MMTRTEKRFWWVLLGLTLALALCCGAASAASSGTWGDLSWELDDEGLLTISGSGSMYDYYVYNMEGAWRANNDEITTVVIEEGVTSIGSFAFHDCIHLTSINIPDSIKSIGNSAFSCCFSLTGTITIPDGVTSIGNNTFSSCYNLTSINLPDSINSIEDGAFSNCSSLISINLPDSIKSIGNSAFSGCSSLTGTITIPDGVTRIDGGTFSGCKNLTSINIPDTINSIGDEAFYNCNNLVGTFTIPDGVTSIGYHTFSGCYKLTSIKIPTSVTSIGPSAFSDCGSLTSINIPDSIKSIGNSAFAGCGLTGTITIPDGVTSIEDGTFYGCPNLTGINIPVSVTSIGSEAFSNCSNLTSINIPDSITSIGSEAFVCCSSLTSINIPRIKSIENSTFAGCTSLTSVSIPDSVTSIGYFAFSNCSNLTSITIPDSVTSLSGSNFLHCTSLSSVTIPASVTTIGVSAFFGCSNLKKAAFLHTDESVSISFGTSNVFPSTTTVYCYMFSPVDGWASGQYPVVYLDEIDINTIRSITLPDDFKLACGESRTISYTLFPDDQVPVTWSSSDSQIVSVNNGTVTAHQPGSAVITAIVGTVSQSLQVEAFTEAKDFELSESEVWLLAKENLQLSVASYTPAGASADITWSSSDTSRATVDQNGLVTSIIPGDVIISADSQNNIHKECLVHLFYPVTAVSFSETAVSVPVGGLRTLEANVTARTQSCVNHLVTFTSSNNSVASVDEDGRIHGLALGTATITATSKSGKTAACTVTVRSANIFTLPSSTITIESEAFAGLTNVDIIVIPASVTSIADDAFAGSDVIIKAPSSSYAYRWAQSHGFQVQTP